MATTVRRSAPLLAAALAVGCVLNVANVSRTATSGSPLAFTTLRSDLRAAGFGTGSVEARGADRVGGHAELTILGLLGSGGSLEAIDRGIAFDWDASMSPVMILGVDYAGPARESLMLERLVIEVPRATAIDLETDDARVNVTEIAAPVRVRTDGGAIFVSGATDVDLGSRNGDIEVLADRATVLSGSGRVDLDVGGDVLVETTAGAVRGSFEEGGSITCMAGGSISVELVGPLTRDLDLGAQAGSIELRVPTDASLDLEISTTGGVHVAVGSVTFDGSGPVVRRLGAGGFRVLAHATTGAVRIVGP
jgi:hypothetical protein